MKTNVTVKLQIEATHQWPGVTEFPELEAVSFLRYPHRHIFHITAKKEVTHDDRDIEIILFKRNLLKYLHSRYYNEIQEVHVLGSTSCEMLAKELTKVFALQYCEVLEDGENGAEVVATLEETTKTEIVLDGTITVEPINPSVTTTTNSIVEVNYQYKADTGKLGI